MGHTDSADRVASGSAGAPEIENEIEITPEMIARTREFLHYSGLSLVTSLADSESFAEEMLRSAINGGR